MKELNAYVVDDEPLAAALIRSYVERTPFLNLVGESHDAVKALSEIKKGNVELVFLDIHMPGLSGMEVAKLLPEGVKVIFTTAYADHAVEGFKVEALDYLLKPVSYDDFVSAALRAQRHFERTAVAEPSRSGEFLLVKSEYRLVRLRWDDIEYIEGLKDYVKIFVEGEKNPILSLMSMKGLEEQMPPSFIRVHRSYIVNLNRVRIIERNTVIMRGECIPVSESYRKAFLEALE